MMRWLLNRNEFSSSMKAFTDSTLSRLSEIGNSQNNQLERFSGQIAGLTKTNEEKLDKVRDTMNEGIRALQGDGNLNSKQSREEISNSLKQLQDSLLSRMTEVCNLQKNQFDGFFAESRGFDPDQRQNVRKTSRDRGRAACVSPGG